MRARWCLGLPLALFLAACSDSGQRPVDPAELPWALEVESPQRVRAFGLWLGEATLADAEQRYRMPAEAGLFLDPGGRLSVEAYFDGITLAGLSAKLVLELQADATDLARWQAAAVRRIGLRSGSVRLVLPEAQDAELRRLPVRSLTYMPRIDLESDTLRQRFGEPQRVVVMDEERSHWLYPDRGLDIIVDQDGREILQYLLPAEFTRITSQLPEG